jgi:hypothetical protein
LKVLEYFFREERAILEIALLLKRQPISEDMATSPWFCLRQDSSADWFALSSGWLTRRLVAEREAYRQGKLTDVISKIILMPRYCKMLVSFKHGHSHEQRLFSRLRGNLS